MTLVVAQTKTIAANTLPGTAQSPNINPRCMTIIEISALGIMLKPTSVAPVQPVAKKAGIPAPINFPMTAAISRIEPIAKQSTQCTRFNIQANTNKKEWCKKFV